MEVRAIDEVGELAVEERDLGEGLPALVEAAGADEVGAGDLVDPAGASTFTWRLGYGAGSDAAAWYVDDIRYVRVAEFPRVRFVAP